VSGFNETWIFSTHFRIYFYKCQILSKSVQCEPNGFYSYEQTVGGMDRHDEANSRFFCDFVNVPKRVRNTAYAFWTYFLTDRLLSFSILAENVFLWRLFECLSCGIQAEYLTPVVFNLGYAYPRGVHKDILVVSKIKKKKYIYKTSCRLINMLESHKLITDKILMCGIPCIPFKTLVFYVYLRILTSHLW
jgi:hypothetical protein